ncbi:MAG: EFR1 family ferrodoxin [Desulfobacterales bacterium]|nr:EFR1 family ferrodoxin [Desulfobacterales bacterium]
MKVLMICFSQTGNTRKVAEHIQEGINEVADTCELIGLGEVDIETLSEYDLVGIGFPVFYYKEPFHISDFVEALPLLQGKQWFVFCSHGSVLGMTLISMTERLEKKDIIVIGSHHTYADASLPFYPYPTVTTGHPDEQDLQEAVEFGKTIASCSLAVAKGSTNCIQKPAPVAVDWVPDQSALLTREFMDKAFPRLSINTETCIQCGDCQEACPVDSIDIEASPPRIQDPCIYCWNCAKICPTCSIETDWSGFDSIAASQYQKYIKALNEAEARGEFRWLVDPKSMNYDDPLHKQKERQLKEEKK